MMAAAVNVSRNPAVRKGGQSRSPCPAHAVAIPHRSTLYHSNPSSARAYLIQSRHWLSEGGFRRAHAASSEGVQTGTHCVRYVVVVPTYKTELGQVLKVVGSMPELGAWNTAAAPLMEWNEGHRWILDIMLPKVSFEFKLVMVAGSQVLWEKGSNRSVQGAAADSEHVEVTCTFDQPDRMAIQPIRHQPAVANITEGATTGAAPVLPTTAMSNGIAAPEQHTPQASVPGKAVKSDADAAAAVAAEAEAEGAAIAAAKAIAGAAAAGKAAAEAAEVAEAAAAAGMTTAGEQAAAGAAEAQAKAALGAKAAADAAAAEAKAAAQAAAAGAAQAGARAAAGAEAAQAEAAGAAQAGARAAAGAEAAQAAAAGPDQAGARAAADAEAAQAATASAAAASEHAAAPAQNGNLPLPEVSPVPSGSTAPEKVWRLDDGAVLMIMPYE